MTAPSLGTGLVNWRRKREGKAISCEPNAATLIMPSRKAVQCHLRELKAARQYRGAPQAALIAELNPKIRGWTLYYQSSVAARLFNKLDSLLHHKLLRWASFRHPRQTNGWRYRRYWRQVGAYMTFSDGTSSLVRHDEMPITRQGARGQESLRRRLGILGCALGA